MRRVAGAQNVPSQIIVVDLGEDRQTRDRAEALSRDYGFALDWLPVGHRLAPSEANRHALSRLSTPYGCLLDSDVLVPDNWLLPMYRLLQSSAVGLVAPLRPDPFLAYPGHPESTERRLEAIAGSGPLTDVVERYFGQATAEQFATAVATANNVAALTSVEFPSSLSSCCLAFNRQIVEDVGGIGDRAFDGQYGSEDVDLSWRVLDAGFEILRTAEIFVVHLRHRSLNVNSVDFESELVKANLLLYTRWRDKLINWGRDRLRRGDSVASLKQRYIIRELMRNTSFERDLLLASAGQARRRKSR